MICIRRPFRGMGVFEPFLVPSKYLFIALLKRFSYGFESKRAQLLSLVSKNLRFELLFDVFLELDLEVDFDLNLEAENQ